MSLRGTAAVAIWSDMQDPPAHDDWHSHEHLVERLRIPGFLRGRRMMAADAGVMRYFVLYEVADAAVMTSPAYLQCLNNPTEWTTRTMGTNRGLNRTLCQVRSTLGRGAGSWLLAMTPQARPGCEEELRAWLVDQVLPTLPTRPGVVAAHLLVRDPTERPRTIEEKLRGRPDDSCETLMLVEGYDPEALRRLGKTLLSESGISAHGASGLPPAQLYALAHLMDPVDALPGA